MPTTDEKFDGLLSRARQGEIDAINELLSDFRPDIRQWIENECGHRASAFVDVSGVTQIALLCIHRELTDFRGSSPEEFQAWAKRISLNRLIDEIRASRSQKRNLQGVQSLETIDQPGTPLREQVADDTSSPSVKVARNEQLLLAIAKLPDDQQPIARGHFVEKLDIETIAARSGISVEDAALRLERSVRNLRRHLRPGE